MAKAKEKDQEVPAEEQVADDENTAPEAKATEDQPAEKPKQVAKEAPAPSKSRIPWLSEFADVVAEQAKVEIVDRAAFEEAVQDTLADLVVARIYVADKKANGILKAKE